MKFLKYIFLGPFSVKNQWVNFKNDMSTTKDKGTVAVLLFFSFVAFYFVGLFIEPDVYTNNNTFPFLFEFGSIVKVYLILIVKLVFLYYLISSFVRSIMKQNIDTYPLISLFLCSITLIWSFHFVFNLVFEKLTADYIISQGIITFIELVIISSVSSFVIVNALYGFFDKKTLCTKSRFKMYDFVTICLVIINFILDFIISKFNHILSLG